MRYFLYSDVEREKKELTKWYDELMQSLNGKLLVSNCDGFFYEQKCVKIDDREYERRIEGFNAVKKRLLKLAPCNKPELIRIEVEDSNQNYAEFEKATTESEKRAERIAKAKATAKEQIKELEKLKI